MGWMFVMGECASCRQTFTFNADLVPSVRVNGHKEPICEHCVEAANPKRLAKGLAVIAVLPGAYEPEEVQ